jgi:hypothetical protein
MEDLVQGLLVLLCPCYVWYWCFTHMGTSPVPVMLFGVGWMMYTFGGIMFRIGDSNSETRNPVPIERAAEQKFACLPPTRDALRLNKSCHSLKAAALNPQLDHSAFPAAAKQCSLPGTAWSDAGYALSLPNVARGVRQAVARREFSTSNLSVVL